MAIAIWVAARHLSSLPAARAKISAVFDPKPRPRGGADVTSNCQAGASVAVAGEFQRRPRFGQVLSRRRCCWGRRASRTGRGAAIDRAGNQAGIAVQPTLHELATSAGHSRHAQGQSAVVLHRIWQSDGAGGCTRHRSARPFTTSGKPATMKSTSSARAARYWFIRPRASRYRRPKG